MLRTVREKSSRNFVCCVGGGWELSGFFANNFFAA